MPNCLKTIFIYKKAMLNTSAKDRFRFLLKWVITNGSVILIGLIASGIIGFIVFFFLMGYDSYEDVGTPFQQTLIMIIGCIVTGLGLGFFQRKLLNSHYKVSIWWMFSIPIGLVVAEVITGLIFNRFGLGGRGEVDYLPNVLIFYGYGLIIGTIQFFILRAYFERSAVWILSNTLALGSGMLVAGSVYDSPLMILTYISGVIIYGLITGATLIWVLKFKEIEK